MANFNPTTELAYSLLLTAREKELKPVAFRPFRVDSYVTTDGNTLTNLALKTTARLDTITAMSLGPRLAIFGVQRTEDPPTSIDQGVLVDWGLVARRPNTDEEFSEARDISLARHLIDNVIHDAEQTDRYLTHHARVLELLSSPSSDIPVTLESTGLNLVFMPPFAKPAPRSGQPLQH